MGQVDFEQLTYKKLKNWIIGSGEGPYTGYGPNNFQGSNTVVRTECSAAYPRQTEFLSLIEIRKAHTVR